jgi:hypothetical protein
MDVLDINNNSYLNEDSDFRLIKMHSKEGIMKCILSIYKMINFPMFLIALLSWFVLVINYFKKSTSPKVMGILIVSSFSLGLFLLRVMTLTIIDATTSIPGIHYGISTNVFIPIFSTIMIYWFPQIKSPKLSVIAKI